MTRKLALDTSGTVALDGSGNGTVKLGPSFPREKWLLNTASIQTSAPNTFPLCSIYVGPQPTAAYIVDTSYLGSGDSTGRVAGYPVSVGNYVWAVWSGGTPGAQATLRVFGDKETP
jgi:hypothetical protein